jgi:hypothetical protein
VVLVAAVASAVALMSVGAASAQDTVGVRGVGITLFSTTSATMWNLPAFCVDQNNATRDCSLAATGNLKVSSATKRKHDLPSRTVAEGDLVPCGEAHCLKMKSSAKVRAKLKGVTSLPVTITFAVSSPVQEKMTKKVTLRTKNGSRVVFQTSNIGGDDAVPGGRG